MQGGVGSGKSRTALAYYWLRETSRMKRPKDLYIITTARKRDSCDWNLEAIYFNIDPYNAPESPIKFTVDSWNNLRKYTEVKNAFFIFDEQRVVGHGAWTKAFLRICKSNRFILLSATPGDTWMDYIPIFIANGFYRNKTEFITRHVVFSRFSKFPKVEKYINVEQLEANRDKILVRMEYEHMMTSYPIPIECDFDAHDLMRVYRGRWNIFDNEPIQNAGHWAYLMRKIVNSHHSRLEKVLNIFEKHKKIIVFYNFDYELEVLKDGLGEYFIRRSEDMGLKKDWRDFENDDARRSGAHAISTNVRNGNKRGQNADDVQLLRGGELNGLNEHLDNCPIGGNHRSTALTERESESRIKGASISEYNGHKHDPIPEGEQWIYLVQYNAGSEAWNCITTDTIVFYSLNYSYKIMEQASGRIRRMNSPFNDLYYYVLYSNSVIDKSILTALKNKKEFQAVRMYNKLYGGYKNEGLY